MWLNSKCTHTLCCLCALDDIFGRSSSSCCNGMKNIVVTPSSALILDNFRKKCQWTMISQTFFMIIVAAGETAKHLNMSDFPKQNAARVGPYWYISIAQSCTNCFQSFCFVCGKKGNLAHRPCELRDCLKWEAPAAAVSTSSERPSRFFHPALLLLSLVFNKSRVQLKKRVGDRAVRGTSQHSRWPWVASRVCLHESVCVCLFEGLETICVHRPIFCEINFLAHVPGAKRLELSHKNIHSIVRIIHTHFS